MLKDLFLASKTFICSSWFLATFWSFPSKNVSAKMHKFGVIWGFADIFWWHSWWKVWWKNYFFVECWSKKIIFSIELRIAKNYKFTNLVIPLKNVTLFKEYHQDLDLNINSSKNSKGQWRKYNTEHFHNFLSSMWKRHLH